MSFLAPLLLGGIALGILPVIIHRIRRPEREVVRFSSLMFVPNVPKEVIERRKIQHFLLMLLRILLLLLLALAFSRPFWSSQEQAILMNKGESSHLILVDTSLSMTMDGRFEKAKDLARGILNGLPGTAKVALASFDRQAVLRQDFTAPTDRRLTSAISGLQARSGSGNYWAGLKFAEGHLLNQQAGDANREVVLHLVSDFQIRNEEKSDWRLSGRIAFQGHRVEGASIENFSISDVEIRRLGTGHQIAAKVKYWHGSEPQQVRISLHFLMPQAPKVEPVSLVLVPGGASLAVFDVPLPMDQAMTGYAAIGDDDLAEDNRRYFHWEPDPKQPILLVTDEAPDQTRTASWFLSQAMGHGPESPWTVERQTPQDWANATETALDGAPMVLVGVTNWPATATAKLKTHLQSGGSAMILMDDGGAGEILAAIADVTGIQLEESQPEVGATALETWQWLAFDHPIFAPFGAARFNDFSQIRLNRWMRLALNGEQAVPLVKTENETVIAEAAVASGKVIVWAFPPKLAWTNLVKNVKFVPVLEESLLYLAAGKTPRTEFETGTSLQTALAQFGSGPASVQLPQGQVLDTGGAEAQSIILDQTGVLSQRLGEKREWQPWAVVNVPFQEGNPEQWNVPEFALRLAANPGQLAQASAASTEPREASLGVRLEFGHYFLWIVGALLLLETWLAFRLSRSQSPKPLKGVS